MSGICGILSLNPRKAVTKSSFEDMLRDLKKNDQQSEQSFSFQSHTHFGLINIQTENLIDNSFQDKKNGILVLIHGNIFINHENVEFKTEKTTDALLRLFKEKREKIVDHLSGWFILLFYDANEDEIFIFNCKSGQLPLFYCIQNDLFIFSSNLNSILKTNLIEKKLNPTTFVEMSLFTYPISNNTLVENVMMLGNSNVIQIKKRRISIKKYWDYSELFKYKNLQSKESFELINETLKKVTMKIIPRDRKVAVTLTGGWDGRLILSYLNTLPKDQFFLYSFGAENSPDILIPQEISKKLDFQYFPFLLDNQYLEYSFFDSAEQVIRRSNCYVNYTRSHYYFTLDKIGDLTDIAISGNGGSNILKNVNKAGSVFNENLLNLFSKDFSTDCLKEIYDGSTVNHVLKTNKNTFENLLNAINSSDIMFGKDVRTNEKFYHFLLSNIERKYFGMEAASYGAKIYNFSPFFDDEFLVALSKTPYIGFKQNFLKSDLFNKHEISRLYARLIKHNFPALCNFNSDKGFSLAEVNSPLYFPKIILKKYISRKIPKKKKIDNYNTRAVHAIFFEKFIKNADYRGKIFDYNAISELFYSEKYKKNTMFFANMMSFIFWCQDVGFS